MKHIKRINSTTLAIVSVGVNGGMRGAQRGWVRDVNRKVLITVGGARPVAAAR